MLLCCEAINEPPLNGQEIKWTVNAKPKGEMSLENRFKEKKKTSTIQVKIESELKDLLVNWAKDEEVTMSEFIRTLLKEEDKKRAKKQK